MKKIILLLVLTFTTISVNAQFFGGFYQADPDAWVDKEPYFACKILMCITVGGKIFKISL